MITENSLIKVATQLLKKNMRSEAGECLNAAMQINPADLLAHNIIEENLLQGNFTTAFGINSIISSDDDIFRFFAKHPSSINPIRDYLADGWRTLTELYTVLDDTGHPLRKCQSFLEFACGHGRFTRHLVKQISPHALHVSDVVPGSVDFLQKQMNVGGFYSTSSPSALKPPRTYEVIFVLSLFSHLPESTWETWLQTLYTMLEPGGVLIFSTHGEKAADNLGAQWPDSGFLFIPASESTALPGEEYGSTFTTGEYVRKVAQTVAPEAQLRAYPGHFWGMQDGYALQRPQKPEHQGFLARMMGSH
jgi:SAM-dependent methyltransferase